MKPTFLKISVFILLFSFLGAGCKKDEEDLGYLDYSKEFIAGIDMPGFAIYKTENDYFFNVPVRPMQNNYIMSPELKEGGYGITLYKGKYYYTERYRLNDNYIVSYAIGADSYFTSLSYDEYIRENLAPVEGVINPKVLNGIVDRDPFTEFYRSPTSFNGKSWITLDELNQLIKDKNLEKYFTKIK